MQKKALDIYVRTSAKGGRSEETLQTLDQQVQDCKEYAAREGLSLTGFVLEDKFRSGGAGKRAKRKALTRALERIKAGESGGIVVAYLSRATREGGTGLQLFEEIDRAGGGIYGPNVPTDWRSADGRLTLGLLLIIDAHVVDKAREHTWKAKARSIERGVPTSPAPCGYERGPDRRYVPSDAAPAVTQAFRMRASGAGVSEIVDFLNASSVKTSRGNAWTVGTVAKMLSNRVYLGQISCGPYTNPTAHAPLVDAETFHAAQKAVRPTRRKARSDASRVMLLSGVARCASCGYALYGTKDNKGLPLYRCARRHAGGVCPNPARVGALALEEAVAQEYLKDGLVLSLPAPRPRDLSALEDAVRATQRRLEQVLSAEARDALGSLWSADVKARREEHEAACAALGEARARSGGEEVERLVDLKKHWRDSFTGEGSAYFLSDLLKRELLARRFAAVAVLQTGRGKWEWFEASPDSLPEAGGWKVELRTLVPVTRSSPPQELAA